jgi:hypothetical protein
MSSLLLIILAGVFFLLFAHAHNTNSNTPAQGAVTTKNTHTINYSPAPSSDNAASENAKSTNPSPSPTDGNSASNNITVTLNATPRGNKQVHVSGLISGVTSGTCTLTATQGGQSKVFTAPVQIDVNSYDCILNPTFPTTGSWNLSLVVSSGGQHATATKAVEVN